MAQRIRDMPLCHLQWPFRDSSSLDAHWQSVRRTTTGSGTHPFYSWENRVIDSHTPRSGRGSPWLPGQGCLRTWGSFHYIVPLAYLLVLLYKYLHRKRHFSLARKPKRLTNNKNRLQKWTDLIQGQNPTWTFEGLFQVNFSDTRFSHL